MNKHPKHLRKKPAQSGFTLVEIAIVLVIIGLILGGVLQGQVMIENAKYKKFVKEIDSYRAAVYTFQDKYQALPGDLATASTLLDAAAVNGNGNGAVAGGTCNAAGEEACTIWSHLRYEGLIAGDPSQTGATARPNHAYGGLVDTIATATWGNGVNELKFFLRLIPGDVAQRYDNEFDDGDATSGRIARNGGSGSTYNQNALLNVVTTL